LVEEFDDCLRGLCHGLFAFDFFEELGDEEEEEDFEVFGILSCD